MISKKIQQIFTKVPEIKYGYTEISYSSFSEEYQSALVLAVPYDKQLSIDNYTEETFDKSILNAKYKLEQILKDIEFALIEEGISYYIPPVAQQNEEELNNMIEKIKLSNIKLLFSLKQLLTMFCTKAPILPV